MDCIFCKIAAGEVPADIVYRDPEIVAFRDIAPKAPVHVLVIPVKHIARLHDLEAEDAPLFGRMALIANQMADREGVAESGYRVLVNDGPDSGQEVFHLHLHLLGGTRLRFLA